MTAKQLAEWNNKYLKYYGVETYGEEKDEKQRPIVVTAHDIVSVINSAEENNIYYFGDMKDWPSPPNDSYYYVQVIVDGKPAEKWTDEDKMKFLKENSLYDSKETGEKEQVIYKCSEEPKVSTKTKRVWQISFKRVSK